MNLLNLKELKSVLEKIAENSRSLKTRPFVKGDKDSGKVIIPTDASPEARFTLSMIVKERPSYLSRISEDEVVLSLDGQIMLDLLSDDKRIASIKAELKRKGHTNPTDRQVYKKLREDLTDGSQDDSRSVTLVLNQANEIKDMGLIEQAPEKLEEKQKESITKKALDNSKK